MQKRWIVIAGMLFILAILYFSCFYYFKKPPAPTTSHNITIGWIGPLSGSTKMIGVDNLKAVKLAIKEYNTSKKPRDPTINLIVKDDSFEAFRSLAAYNELLQGKPKPTIIFINTYSGLLKIAEKATEDNIILINPIDNDINLALSDNIFLIAKLSADMSSILTNAMIADKKERVAIFYYSADYFMTRMTRSIGSILRSHGIQIILLPYQPDKTDFTPDLKAATNFKADAYVFLGYVRIGMIMKQARDMGIKVPFYSLNTIADPEIQKKAGNALEGTQFVYFTSLDGNRGLAKLFLDSFKKEYHANPKLEWSALQAYDATTILLKALVKTSYQPGKLIDNLRNNLLNVSKYPGVSGDITIQSTGAAIGIHPHLYLYKNGQAIPKE